MKTGESGLTVFRLLTKDNCWKWVQANARLVYKNGKPDYIIATQRPLMYVNSSGPCHIQSQIHTLFGNSSFSLSGHMARKYSRS